MLGEWWGSDEEKVGNFSSLEISENKSSVWCGEDTYLLVIVSQVV